MENCVRICFILVRYDIFACSFVIHVLTNLSCYKGQKGSINTIHGVKIAFVSGILSSPVTDLPNTVDILLTHEWPESVTRLATQNVPTNVGGSAYVANIALAVKPRYHFATSEKVFYRREPYQNSPSPNLINDEDSQMQFGHPTWFIGLAEVGNAAKSKVSYKC